MGKCDELKFCKKKRSGTESIDNNILSIYTHHKRKDFCYIHMYIRSLPLLNRKRIR